MQNEILKPVLATDEVAVPRYDIVGPNGTVIQQNVELRLKNEVVQEGTPYDEDSVLPASLRDRLNLTQGSTPAEAFWALLAEGGAVVSNRAPTATDAQPPGRLWVVPRIFFNNLLSTPASMTPDQWATTAATVATTGDTATFTGNGSNKTFSARATLTSYSRKDRKLYLHAEIVALNAANEISVVWTNSLGKEAYRETLSLPDAGQTLVVNTLVPVPDGGVMYMDLTAAYNSAAVASGQKIQVSKISIIDLTRDMSQAAEGLEFTLEEITSWVDANYPVVSKKYELSQTWWLCWGIRGETYYWYRYDDLANLKVNLTDKATQTEAVGGSDDSKWMTPLATQQFLTNRIATQSEAQAGSNNAKVMTPARTQQFLTAKLATEAEALAGTNNTKVMTPLRTKQVAEDYSKVIEVDGLKYHLKLDTTVVVLSGLGAVSVNCPAITENYIGYLGEESQSFYDRKTGALVYSAESSLSGNGTVYLKPTECTNDLFVLHENGGYNRCHILNPKTQKGIKISASYDGYYTTIYYSGVKNGHLFVYFQNGSNSWKVEAYNVDTLAINSSLSKSITYTSGTDRTVAFNGIVYRLVYNSGLVFEKIDLETGSITKKTLTTTAYNSTISILWVDPDTKEMWFTYYSASGVKGLAKVNYETGAFSPLTSSVKPKYYLCHVEANKVLVVDDSNYMVLWNLTTLQAEQVSTAASYSNVYNSVGISGRKILQTDRFICYTDERDKKSSVFDRETFTTRSIQYKRTSTTDPATAYYCPFPSGVLMHAGSSLGVGSSGYYKLLENGISGDAGYAVMNIIRGEV